MSRRAPAVLLAAIALFAPACSDTAADGPAPTADRVAAVREARGDLAEPATQLGTAAIGVREAVEQLSLAPGPETVELLEQALDELDAATAELAEVDLAADTDEVRAAGEAVDRATGAADQLAEAGDTVAEAGRRVAEVDPRLEELIEAWDERGSRSEVLARLEEVAASAEELVADGPEGCAGPVEARNAAAHHVAEATRELREFVASRDGPGYDDRRAELAEAPYGHGDDETPRRLDGLAAGTSTACPARDEATDAADEVAAALEELEAALNPSDLAS